MPSQASILVVEDDHEQRRLYAKILRGHRLTFAATGTAALTGLDAVKPNLIILDHVLADGERGTDFLPQIKRLAAHVPVIVISGTLTIRDQINALQGPLSAHYVIEKPVDIDALEETVEKALAACGIGETVAMLKSLENAEKDTATDPERRFTERLARQHAILNIFRETTADQPSISSLARHFHVDRKTVRRDVHDLVQRGDLPASTLASPDETA